MDIEECNAAFEQVVEKISAENKEIYLLGNFNMELLKLMMKKIRNKLDDYDNILCTNFPVPYITPPTRITPKAATWSENIFSNNLDFANTISGNLTVSISDHVPQILIAPKDNIKGPKQIVDKRAKNMTRGSSG